jgi:hypothetical protein
VDAGTPSGQDGRVARHDKLVKRFQTKIGSAFSRVLTDAIEALRHDDG